MIKAYKEEVFCAVVSEMITAQVLFVSGCKRMHASITWRFKVQVMICILKIFY